MTQSPRESEVAADLAGLGLLGPPAVRTVRALPPQALVPVASAFAELPRGGSA